MFLHSSVLYLEDVALTAAKFWRFGADFAWNGLLSLAWNVGLWFEAVSAVSVEQKLILLLSYCLGKAGAAVGAPRLNAGLLDLSMFHFHNWR